MISDYLFDTATTVIATAATFAVFAILWYAVPLHGRSQLVELERRRE